MPRESSDGEEFAQIKQTTDVKSGIDSLFNGGNKTTESVDMAKLPSLRRPVDEDNEFDTSPEFRGYVAKHLTEALDSLFTDDETPTESETPINKKRKVKKNGVKLLSSSATFLTSKKPKPSIAPPFYQNPKTMFNEKENLKRCKQVAVSPFYILSRQEPQTWSTRSKAPIYRYTKTQNGLTEIT